MKAFPADDWREEAGEELRRRSRELAPGPSEEVWSSERETALVERILQATTREDLSWRGELRLVGGFLRERLESSFWWRVLAASVALHLAAVPAVGWWLARSKQEDRFRISYQSAPEVPAVEPEREPVRVLEDPQPTAAEAGLFDPDPARTANVLRRDRYLLKQAAGRYLTEGIDPEGAPLEIRLLVARSLGWEGASLTPWVTGEEVLEAGDVLALALFAQVCLDRVALHGEGEPWGPLFSRLSAHGADRRWDHPSRALVQLVLARAQAYGTWPATTLFDPLELPEPLGEAFQEALEQALGETRLDSPVIESWVGTRAR